MTESTNNLSIGGEISTPEQIAKALRDYNAWRRGNEAVEQPRPADIGLVIDAAIAMLDGIDAERGKESAAKCSSPSRPANALWLNSEESGRWAFM